MRGFNYKTGAVFDDFVQQLYSATRKVLPEACIKYL